MEGEQHHCYVTGSQIALTSGPPRYQQTSIFVWSLPCLHSMGSNQPQDFGQLQRYMQPNLSLTSEQVEKANQQAEFLEKAAAVVRQKAEEGHRRYLLEQQLRKQVEEGERAR